MTQLSIITVVSDEDTYKFGLEESLGEQTFSDYELIKVDNIGNKYDCLALAYEEGLERSSAEWLCFVHPDLRFDGEDALYELFDRVKELSATHDEIKLYGVAGVTGGADYHLISGIRHGYEKKRAGDDKPLRDGFAYVQTLDACCIFIERSDIERFGFWNGGYGFHMLVEELCLHIEDEGYRVAVVPADVWHFSDGRSLDYSYFRELRHLLKGYKKLDYINTTSHSFKVTWYLPLHLLYREYRSFVWHQILGR